MPVSFYDLGSYLFKARIVFSLIVDGLELILDSKGRHHGEALKLHVLIRHRRQGFCGFEDIEPYDPEITYTLDTLSGELGIPVIQQDALFIVNGLCQSHSLFKLLLSNK